VRPWLPLTDAARRNVADQVEDPDSVLSFTRRAIARRSGNEDLALGSYSSLDSPEDTWVFQRGRGTVVALNMSDAARETSGLRGSITLATDREREGHQVDGVVTMAPWSGLVVET
jgi:alpha-glucosidase